MKPELPEDLPEDRDPEDRDPVWALLQRARKTEIDPFFSRNVLRAVRQTQTDPSEVAGGPVRAWWRGLFSPTFRIAWGAAVVAVGIITVAVWSGTHHPAGTSNVAGSAPDSSDAIIDQVASELAMLEEVDDILNVRDAQQLSDDDLGKLLF